MSKPISSAVCALLLVLFANLAQASFTETVSGPSFVSVGETLTLNVHFTYTPIDLNQSIFTPSPFFFFVNSFARDTAGYALVPTNGNFPNTVNFIPPPAAPSEADRTIQWTFDTAGIYQLQFIFFRRENVAQVPTALCQLPTCDPGEVSDELQFPSDSGTLYRVEVFAVPEPETYAMLLAGLGLFGFAARRRKQQAA